MKKSNFDKIESHKYLLLESGSIQETHYDFYAKDGEHINSMRNVERYGNRYKLLYDQFIPTSDNCSLEKCMIISFCETIIAVANDISLLEKYEKPKVFRGNIVELD